MVKRIAAIILIFGFTTVAWMILGATIFQRTYQSRSNLQGQVASSWGQPHEQRAPIATFIPTKGDTSATAHMPDVLEMPYRPEVVGGAAPGVRRFTYRLGGATCLAAAPSGAAERATCPAEAPSGAAERRRMFSSAM